MSIKGICEKCGREGTIHCHHKDGNHDYDVVTNKQNLCPSCHRLAHGSTGLGAGEVRFPVPDEYPLIPWAEVRAQYFACFPRA